MIKAVIYDMDGVIIDSEPFWQDAEMKVFGSVGVSLTREMCMETMGLRVDEVVQYRYNQYKWNGKTVQQVHQEILAELEQLILTVGTPMPGVKSTIDFFTKKGLRLALASSTHLALIRTVLQKFKIEGHFEAVHSAQFEEYGKPHPGIYITTLKKLGLQPDEALAIEDSFNGLLAAKSARLRTIVVPEKSLWHETRYDIADLKLKSLAEFSEEHFKRLVLK